MHPADGSGASNGGGANAAEDSHLRGRRLVLARSGWITVTVLIVALNVISFRDLYASNFSVTPQVLHELHRLNLSPTLYGVLLTVENAQFQLVYVPLGLLLFLRRSDDRMALFCAFTLVTFGGAVPFYDFSSGGVEPSLAANPVLRIAALSLFALGEISLVLFFYLFPSGRFVPRWTRWAALLVAAYYLAVVFFPTLPSDAGGPATYVIPLALLSAAIAQIYRYRRISSPREREQTKWAVFGFALGIILIAANIPLGILLPSSIKASPVLENLNPVFSLALSLFPIFITIAILRARLWDIDVLINKALVYGLLTALLAGVYAGLVIGLESLVGALTGQRSQQPALIVASTLAIAALFQPLRRRIQGFIDRRFYRRKYDAAKTLAAFGATLRTETDLEALSMHLLAAVQQTMQPVAVTLWLRTPERRAPTWQTEAPPPTL